MNIALTVWEDRISPVFDAATTLLLVEIRNGGIAGRRFAPLHPAGAMRLGEMLKQMDVSVLICGAISEGYANRLSFTGIELIPFISGKTERILETFVKEEPLRPVFSMPGCGAHCRRRQTTMPSPNLIRKEVTTMPNKDGTGPTGQGRKTGQGEGRCKSGSGAGKGKNPGRGQGRKGGSDQGRQQSK